MDAFVGFERQDVANKQLIATAILRGASMQHGHGTIETMAELVVGLVEGDAEARNRALGFFKVGIADVSQDGSGDDASTVFPDFGLNKVIREASLHSQMRKIFLLWPNLKVATARFAEYVTPLLNGSDNCSLLEESLLNAVKAYNAERDESLRARAYLFGLTDMASHLTRISIKGKYSKGFATWVPFSQPISDWMKRYRIKTIKTAERSCPCDPETARSLLMSRILTIEDLNMADLKLITQGGRHD